MYKRRGGAGVGGCPVRVAVGVSGVGGGGGFLSWAAMAARAAQLGGAAWIVGRFIKSHQAYSMKVFDGTVFGTPLKRSWWPTCKP